jgi:hypothetical protein
VPGGEDLTLADALVNDPIDALSNDPIDAFSNDPAA